MRFDERHNPVFDTPLKFPIARGLQLEDMIATDSRHLSPAMKMMLISLALAGVSSFALPENTFAKQVSGETQTCTSPIVDPLYRYPNWYEQGYFWNEVAKMGTCGSAIINPDNGPGQGFPNVDYAEGLRDLHALGVKTRGYSYSSYAMRDKQEIIAEADTWLSAVYTPTGSSDVKPAITGGLFIDEVTSDSAHVGYYDDIVTAITNNHPEIPGFILNPGVPPDELYYSQLPSNVQIMMFENSLAEWDAQKNSFPAWLNQYPGRSLAIVYDVSDKQTLCRVYDEMVGRGISGFYITDDNLVDTPPGIPYDELPSYWGAEREAATTGVCKPYNLFIPLLKK